MSPLLSTHEGQIKFEVFYEPEPIFDFDFETLEQEREYKARFESGELSKYGVVKYDICPCCCVWREINSLWNIDAESPQLALEYYKSY